MIKNMLNAVIKMLDCDASTPIPEFKARVSCAKVILEELVDGLASKEPLIFNYDHQMEEEEKVRIVPAIKPHPHQVGAGYEVVVDPDGKLVNINNLSDDAIVEVDGRAMTHAEAKGKPFNKGRIL